MSVNLGCPETLPYKHGRCLLEQAHLDLDEHLSPQALETFQNATTHTGSAAAAQQDGAWLQTLQTSTPVLGGETAAAMHFGMLHVCSVQRCNICHTNKV